MNIETLRQPGAWQPPGIHNSAGVGGLAVALAAQDTLKNHPGMDPERAPRVFFDEFNDDSFNIRMSYWYHLNEYWDFVAFNEKVNFEIFRAFEDQGIQFSLPSRITYWATDSEQRPLEVKMVERKES